MRHKNERMLSMCKASHMSRTKKRLSSALNYRPPHSITVFELSTNNPISGIKHNIKIKNESFNGNNRYNVYLDGELWREQWSRYGFCRWLFKQIDSVVVR